MTEQEMLFERFEAIAKKAAKWGENHTHLDYKDLLQHAAERLLMYGTGEGWSHSDKLRSTDGPEVNRFVMRALQGDILDYAAADRRQRNLDTYLSTDQIVDEGTESQKGAVYVLDDVNAIRQQGGMLASILIGRDTQWADLLYDRFPLLMANVDGQTEREIADDVGLSRDQVHARIIKQRGQFVRMVMSGEFPQVPPAFYNLLETGESRLPASGCADAVNGNGPVIGHCVHCDALATAADIDLLNQRIPERSFYLEIRAEWLDEYQPCSEEYAEKRLEARK